MGPAFLNGPGRKALVASGVTALLGIASLYYFLDGADSGGGVPVLGGDFGPSDPNPCGEPLPEKPYKYLYRFDTSQDDEVWQEGRVPFVQFSSKEAAIDALTSDGCSVYGTSAHPNSGVFEPSGGGTIGSIRACCSRVPDFYELCGGRINLTDKEVVTGDELIQRHVRCCGIAQGLYPGFECPADVIQQ